MSTFLCAFRCETHGCFCVLLGNEPAASPFADGRRCPRFDASRPSPCGRIRAHGVARIEGNVYVASSTIWYTSVCETHGIIHRDFDEDDGCDTNTIDADEDDLLSVFTEKTFICDGAWKWHTLPEPVRHHFWPRSMYRDLDLEERIAEETLLARWRDGGIGRDGLAE